MAERLALLSENLEKAKQVVETLRIEGYNDDSIYVITKDDIILEDLPEADPRQYSDVFAAAKRGAGVGGALGLFSGLLIATVPPAGIALGGAAITALTAGSAVFGAWTSSMVGISVPNTQLEPFAEDVDAGKTLILVDVKADEADALLGRLEAICEAELLETANLDHA